MNNEQKLILVADDDPQLSRMLTRILQNRGYEVAVAGNGQEGLDKAAVCRPDDR